MRRVAAVLLGLGLGAGVPGNAGAGAPASGRLAWSYTTAAGYDTYVQRFPLAGTDTTETVSEFDLTLGAEARTAGRARQHWWLRPELSAGTELTRERVDLGWQYRPDSLAAVLRLDARWQARQYRGGTRYSLSSDAQGGRLEARANLAPRGRRALETRLHGSYLRHAEPATLTLDQNEVGGGLFWKSGQDAQRQFLLGARLARRTYPDSTAVDRTIAALEGELDTAGFSATGLRAWLHCERRTIRDESARPSAWASWSSFDWLIPAGPARLSVELQIERWDYDAESSAWFDSWRLGGAVLYRSGQPGAGTSWLAGLAAERLDADSQASETYSQAGVRVGCEAWGRRLIGSGTLEVGRRDYTWQADASATDESNLLGTTLDEFDLYSDFTYWRLALNASWRLTDRLSLDLAAHCEPESHTEPADDSTVGFGHARLAWRW